MRRRTRIIGVALLSAVAVLAASCARSFGHFYRVERQFAYVHVGDQRTAVEAKLGKPNYHEGDCGVIGQTSKNCTAEYVYSHPLAPWIPDYYIVEFSSDDRVIEANRWTSP